MIDHPDKPATQPPANGPSSMHTVPPTLPPPSKSTVPATKPASVPSASSSESVSSDVALEPPAQNSALPKSLTLMSVPLLQPTKTLLQVFELSGLDIGGSCTQLLQIIDRSLSSVLAKEMYERVLGDLEARLEYEVTGEIEAEDE